MTKTVYGPHPVAPLSAAVRAGDFVFLSGQIPFGPDGNLVGGNIETQTRQVLDNIAAALALADATLADVVKTTIWLTDPADFQPLQCSLQHLFSQALPCPLVCRVAADGGCQRGNRGVGLQAFAGLTGC